MLQSIALSGATVGGLSNMHINMQDIEEPANATHPVNWRIIAGQPVISGTNTGVMTVKGCSCKESRHPPSLLIN